MGGAEEIVGERERDNNLQGVSYVMVGVCLCLCLLFLCTQDSAWKTGPSYRCRTTGRLLRCVVHEGVMSQQPTQGLS